MKNFYDYAQKIEYKEIYLGQEVLPYLQKCLDDGTTLGKIYRKKQSGILKEEEKFQFNS